jgi:hypothetical protein
MSPFPPPHQRKVMGRMRTNVLLPALRLGQKMSRNLGKNT